MDFLFLETFGKAFVPKRARPHIRLFFEKAGRDDIPYVSFGIIFWLSLVISYLVYITQVYPALIGQNPLTFFIITFIIFTGLLLVTLFVLGGLGYFYLHVKIFSRTKQMEEALADYLTLVSTSLKGGYSFENALWGAIRPEFGVLAKEVGLVSKKVMTGNDVADALDEFSRKYESPILRRSMGLIIGELESGGKIVDVIDRVIVNLKKTKALKEELAASTLTYMIFIAILVMFVMPGLFALSFILFSIITGFTEKLASQVSADQMGTFNISAPEISPTDFKIFSVIAICTISTASAMIVSIIEKGDIRGSAKYIPLFLAVALVVYFVILKLLTGLFLNLVVG